MIGILNTPEFNSVNPEQLKIVTEWANAESRVNSHFDAGYESARTWVKLHLAAKCVETSQ
ncbi:hypothetical protein UFOVP607_8 [uncultured Caudovirales phage]|uniref:Uncharacterized protein n=1 Tax=uncultured Caudovirales phage TaxID=2100421 RepID=A0A6J5N1Y0_9CAUD|nr:hypothetical protein UFOVP607_8 [uncultured Caudovirales phage]